LIVFSKMSDGYVGNNLCLLPPPAKNHVEDTEDSTNVEDLDPHPDDATTVALGEGGGDDVAPLADVEEDSDGSDSAEHLGTLSSFYFRCRIC
jgi:hypothetical protein